MYETGGILDKQETVSLASSERSSDAEAGLTESSMHHVNVHAGEGWILAPPPIFTAINRRTNHLSDPLENLLIEHPSMSVYNAAPDRLNNHPVNSVLHRSAIENASEAPQAPPQDVRPHQRHAGHVLAAKQMSTEMRGIIKGQASERKTSAKAINRGKMERANMVYAIPNTKVLRRKSRMASTPSGYCNNRKC